MQARIVAARRGARWLAEGWRIFRAAPLAWVALVLAYLLLTQILALVPLVGSAVAALLVPGFTVGLMAGARAAAAGGKVELGVLFEGLRQDARRQLMLGGVYLACIAAVLALTALADQDGAVRGALSGQRPAQELDAGELLGPALAFALSYAPVMMLFWFAPPLAAWHGASVGKSLFFSFFACLLNWRAFAAYGLVTAAVMLAVPLAVLTGVAVLSGGERRLEAGAVMLPLALLMLPILFASFYASYRDVFGPEKAPPGDGPGPEPTV